MASIARVDVHEAVSRSAREDGKIYDEALKEFFERFERSLLNFDWIEANLDEKGAEFLKDIQRRAAEKYQNAKEKYKNESEGLLHWIASNLVLFEENRNEL